MEITNYLNATAPTQHVEVNGINFSYRSFGEDKGTPLVCLQHITGTMDNWDPIITNGLSHGRRVILFDNTGVGSTTGETPDNIQSMALDAISFIKVLKLGKVDLLAYSLGGFVGQLIVDQDPALVRKLILVGTGPKGGPGIDKFRDYMMDAVKKPGDEAFLYLFFSKSEKSRDAGKATLKRLSERTEDRDVPYSQATFLSQTKAIEDWGLAEDKDFELLKNIKHPVLIVNGNNDEMFPTINSYYIFQNIPNAQLSLYPDASHGSFYQYPHLFTSQAVYFLDND